ncbi:hypothetical protein CN899_07965 [Bacillus thuringiensis]|uniref:Bacteriophage Gp15 protein n=1 Tax=Bacillus thuringiensis TaxID=1428 RepID=A0A9X7C1S2_BACTU|nr:Gp15 family bacteriophage protein [Bacillus thuringiensis]PGH85767.1 hypothetical protein CN899_07965 [Bacillus thuringiensis]
MFWREDDPYQLYEWNNIKFEVNLSFDNVLTFFELMEDEELTNNEKFWIAFEMFVEDEGVAESWGLHDRTEFILDFLRDKLQFDLRSNKNEENREKIPSFDFVEDSGRIYASFLFDYNMDLYAQQGKMSWSTFLSLFENLSSNTPFSQAVHYRTVKVPKKDKYNEDEIRHIHAMKEKYALKSDRIKKKLEKQQGQEAISKAMSFLHQIKGRQSGGEGIG